ncbi:MAG: radical SAM protein [bacterium]
MEKLDCLLISPSIFYENRDNIWKEINSNFPPLGLASIAGHIRSKGYSVRIIDCNVVSPSVESFNSYFQENIKDKIRSIRIIGLTAMTCTIKKAYKIAEICKKHYPEAKIIFGGVHASFVTEEVISKDFVDIVVIGEGEITLEEILSNMNLEEIKGIVFKRDNKVIKTPERERIVNLDSMAMPAYDLLPILKYRPAKGSYKRLPAMSMMTSRGCPGRCTFCNKTLGSKLISKSAVTIFNEIRYLINNYGIKQILFYDDTFTVFKKNIINLCDLLIKNKKVISWTCFARVDCIDFEMLKKMKKAGCHQIMYGVESIDENVLKNVNKKINPNQVINAVKWTKKAKIECRLAFMVGNPGDNEEIIRKNITFINKIEPDYLIVNITTPFPGTSMFEWAKNKNLILTYDWDDYNFGHPIMKLENLSVDEIKYLYKLMYRSFYFRPKYILKKLVCIRSFDDLKILLEGFGAVVSFMKPKHPVN